MRDDRPPQRRHPQQRANRNISSSKYGSACLSIAQLVYTSPKKSVKESALIRFYKINAYALLKTYLPGYHDILVKTVDKRSASFGKSGNLQDRESMIYHLLFCLVSEDTGSIHNPALTAMLDTCGRRKVFHGLDDAHRVLNRLRRLADGLVYYVAAAEDLATSAPKSATHPPPLRY